MAQLMDHVRRAVDDPQISITTLSAVEPSPIAPVDGPGFRDLDRTIRRVFPGALVAPGLVVAGTDSRHYLGLAGECIGSGHTRSDPRTCRVCTV